MTDGTAEYNADQLPHQRLLRPRQDARSSGSPSPRRKDLAPHGAHRRRAHARLAALGDDARALRRHRGQLARRDASASRTSRSPRRPRFVGRAVAALAADPDRARCNGASLVQRRAGAGVRLHRPRRQPAGLLALHGRGPGPRPAGEPGPVPRLALEDLAVGDLLSALPRAPCRARRRRAPNVTSPSTDEPLALDQRRRARREALRRSRAAACSARRRGRSTGGVPSRRGSSSTRASSVST